MRGRDAGEESTERWERTDWWGVQVEAPDPRAVGRFYSELLGWRIHHEDDDEVVLDAGQGVAYLGFQRAGAAYEPPVWPAEPGRPRQMLHLDFEVGDLDAAVQHAVELGGRLVEHQPQDDVRVLLDPAGHPFCLYT
ncbi:VOC family protein [Nocardioides sp. 1609]|uniref:VOC family protein n=1 Tax=Nocardioides sp. 1609 TaxID=2508327 RepID=UPI001070661D|nr:VOC family protein [Nocardioides sp. 1609]